MSGVTYHMSGVKCLLSGVMFFVCVFLDKLVELVGGGTVINGAYPVLLFNSHTYIGSVN